MGCFPVSQLVNSQIFIASTVFDLRDVRGAVKTFLADHGFIVRVSENADFPILLGHHSYETCLAQVEKSDFVILLIDSRYGGTIKQGGTEVSITQTEFRHAINNNIPVRTFVRWEIWDERNRFKMFLRGVDEKDQVSRFEAFELFKKQSPRTLAQTVGVYDFIDEVSQSKTDNYIHQFHDAGDVIDVLKQQLGSVLAQLYGQPNIEASLQSLTPPPGIRRLVDASTKYRLTNEEIDGQLQASGLASVPRLAVITSLHRLARNSRAAFANEMVPALGAIKSNRGTRLDFYVSDTSIEMLRADSWQSDENHRRVLLASVAIAKSVPLRRTRYRRVLMIDQPQTLGSNPVAAACLTEVVAFHQRSEIGLGVCLRHSVLPGVDLRLLNYYLRPGRLVAVYDFVSGHAAEVDASDPGARELLQYFTDISSTVISGLEREDGGFWVSPEMLPVDVLRETIRLDR